MTEIQRHPSIFAITLSRDPDDLIAKYDGEEKITIFRGMLVDGFPVTIISSYPISPDLLGLLRRTTLAEMKMALSFRLPVRGDSELCFRIRKVKMS